MSSRPPFRRHRPLLALAGAFALPFAAPAQDPPAPASIHLTIEFVEVSLADWTGWIQENALRNDATALRQTVQEWIAAKRAAVFEAVTVHGRSGQRSKAESISEIIYPTEFGPAEVPQTLSQVHNLVESPATAVAPKTFETRNVGVTVEVDPVVSQDGASVDLNLSPEIVLWLGNDPWPNREVDSRFRMETPRFFTAKLTTQMIAPAGKPALVGTMRLPQPKRDGCGDPIVLVFVRADLP